MHRIGLGVRRFRTLLLALMLCATVAAASAVAEEAHFYEGEPTDPEGALAKLTECDIDLGDHGLDRTAPTDETAYDSWLQAVMDLLRSLGLLPPEASSP